MKPATNEETKSVIAHNVKTILGVLGWSQNKLAAESGEKAMLISSVCNRECVVNAASLKRIADALNVTVDRLYQPIGVVPQPHRARKSVNAA